MFWNFFNKHGEVSQRRFRDIDPDEILLDSKNLPNFDVYQFEGRIEKPIPFRTVVFFGIFCLAILLFFLGRSYFLQVSSGDEYYNRSEKNRLRNTTVFSQRGVISDRNGTELAWNMPNEEIPEYSLRKYIELDGFSHLLGYIKYPSKDKYGYYYNEDFIGKSGIEKNYNSDLSGTNGLRIVETNALGALQTESILRLPKDGENIKLSVDASVQNEMYKAIKDVAENVDFVGGAGILLDINTGEVLAITSYPEYNSQILTDGSDSSKISKYLNDKRTPFLNRAIEGLYTPGSTVKPFMSVGILAEKIIDPNKFLFTEGYLSVPNPYDPTKPTIFKDWKNHGYVDMRKALAMSSDVYFYITGGGFGDQKGLGIDLINKYMNMFGFGQNISLEGYFSGPSGVVPNQKWKADNFDGESWKVGNTYHTSIGQYGFQVTPMQMVRAVASLANGGTLLDPTILSIDSGQKPSGINLNLNKSDLKIIKEGMRMAVTEGMSKSLDFPNLKVAVKTGTAELGVSKLYVNSWVTGFFPYDNPKYAFAVIMEKGSVSNTYGATGVMKTVLDWMQVYASEYL
jgi:penicillin-binding protein 2